MYSKDLVYKIALGIIPGIGDINARKLVDHFGSVESVFDQSYRELIQIPGIGSTLAKAISTSRSLERAEKEIEFIEKYKIKTSFYLDDDYPGRLRECADSPVMIFYKGDISGDAKRVISVIGTRKASKRGKELCSSIISALAEKYPDLVIVSGLAYGIDICAHKSALKNDIATIGVMAHGFRTLYPSAHTGVARKMIKKGALVSDFLSDEPPDRNNFLKRNRIIAGMADATLVIESGIKGGAMVTADIAQSYNREVLAIPGSPGTEVSSGCNMLIKSQKASLVENDIDIEHFLNWSSDIKAIAKKNKILPDLSKMEKDILTLIETENQVSADTLSQRLGKPIQNLSSALLNLEFSGLISSQPGNIYTYNKD